MEQSSNAFTYAAPVFPEPGFNEALRTIKSSSNIASRLRVKLEAEPAAIVETTIDSSFTRLFDNAASALKACRIAWETQLQARIKDWQVIAEVIAKLVAEDKAKSMQVEARRLKTAIDSLLGAKTKLPQTEQDVSKVQSDLNDLSDSVSQLGLDTPFGKFLQDAASLLGADLGAAQTAEVSKQISELNLSKVFRVHLAS